MLPSLRTCTRALVAALAALVVFVVAPRVAHAQAIAVSTAVGTSYPRLDSGGGTIQKRAANLTPEGVSYQDCLDGQQIQIPLVVTGPEPSAQVQVWGSASGADCTQPTARTGATQQCWQIAPNSAVSTNFTVNLPVRNILSGVLTPTTPDNSAGICGKVDLVTVTVYFLYFSPGAQAGASTSNANVTVQADTIGPDPPSGLSTLPGNTRLQISWNSISGEGGTVALTGVAAYCDVQGSATTTVTTDATTATTCIDAGEDAAADLDADCTTTTTPGSTTQVPVSGCTSPAFVSADGGGLVIPDSDFNSRYLCGSLVGSTGSSLIATTVGGQPLTNGTHYAVAVAGTDAFGNVGRLSTPVCDYPEPTTDFWQTYKDDGGGGGGGLCSTSGAGIPFGSFTALGLVGLTALSFVKRRTKK